MMYLILLIAYLVWRVLRLSLSHKWRSTILHEVGLVLFVLALLYAGKLTVFPPYATGQRYLNLIPFEVIRRSWNAWVQNGSPLYFYTNVIGNILLLMSVGFFVPLLFRVRWGFGVLIALCLSVAIEIAQYPQCRWSDVDDIWLNVLGAAMGMVFYVGLSTCLPKFTGAFKVR